MKNKKAVVVGVWLFVILFLFVGVLLNGQHTQKHETVKEVMRDAVLHDTNQVSLFGIKDVNPAFISAVTVTALLLAIAVIIRIFFVPKFQYNAGRFQLLLEQLVGTFDQFAKDNSPHRNRFLGAYIFGAGMYIFFGTLFELFGVQAVTTAGHPVTLPAPLSDINGAIALGCLSYSIILFGGILANGVRGLLMALKDFSMPLSMSFRMFGAMLSGVLVTELVYYYLTLSFVLPVLIGVLFTVLHAVIQAYVLVMLTANTYGEVAEPHLKKENDRQVPVVGG